MTTKNKTIPVRVSDDLYEMIDIYAYFRRITKSEAIRELITAGCYQQSHMIRNTIKAKLGEGTKCAKCESTKNLVTYHIDRNIRNLDEENLITLCMDCLKDLEKSLKKFDPRKEFLIWFYKN